MDGTMGGRDDRREAAHLAAQTHAGVRLGAAAPEDEGWGAHPAEQIAACEILTQETLVDAPALAWEGAGPEARCALEALAECLLARDAEALGAAAESFSADEVAGGLEELGAHLAPLVEGGTRLRERDDAASLAYAWRDTVRDGVLALSAHDARALEETAQAWAAGARLHAGQIRAGDGPETIAEHAFAGEGPRRTGALAQARIARAASERLGYGPGEIPDDEPGLDAVREALRADDPTARALATAPPLHERLENARAQGLGTVGALIVEQAAAGPCLDAPHASTLARVRGAMVEAIDPARRAREDCVRAILSAARDALEPPVERHWAPRSHTPGALARGVAQITGVHPAFASIVQSAREAAAAPDIGRVWAFGLETAAKGAPARLVPALEAALASAKAARAHDRPRWAGRAL